jgi:hypothetical protein
MRLKFAFIFTLLLICIFGNSQDTNHSQAISFDQKKAEYLYHFAYECIDQEYPNKLNQIIEDESMIAPPHTLHPAFYGCFDWHSSVHGHWALVTILTEFPNFRHKEEIISKLKKSLTKANIQKEIEYFDDRYSKTYERTYGWAWLLKLDEALREWKHPEAKEMHQNLLPLVDLIAGNFTEFLDKLIYPIRIGEHNNIAFGMSFAYDYAKKYDPILASKIEEKAREYYYEDCECPLTWEPGGFDFLSPCLKEASVMHKVLSKKEFQKWLKKFLPKFEKDPTKFMEIAVVTDRSDGKLAHLDGLNFSRAWCLFEIGETLNNPKMIDFATKHFNYSYEKMDSGEYAGSHWLASFATYALISSGNAQITPNKK